MSNKSFKEKIDELKKKKMSENKVIQMKDLKTLEKKKASKTVVIVEDDKDMAITLKKVLSSKSYDCLLAEDAIVLAQILDTRIIDLIILDINLPWVSGLEVCKLLSEDKKFFDIPVILISARKSLKDRQTAESLGYTDFLHKPFSSKEIIALAQKLSPV